MIKKQIDEIIKLNLAQPVGNGYIDVIVQKNYCMHFVSQIYNANTKIDGISWWEYCEPGISPKIGLGGPKCFFMKGWYSEIPIELDKCTSDQSADEIINTINQKSIELDSEIYSFKNNDIVPAFWLDVPDSWKNEIDRDPFYTKYYEIVIEIINIINKWDPIKLIHYGAPDDEYDVEINDFLPKKIVYGAENTVHESFIKMFGDSYQATKEEAGKIETEIDKIIEKKIKKAR